MSPSFCFLFISVISFQFFLYLISFLHCCSDLSCIFSTLLLLLLSCYHFVNVSSHHLTSLTLTSLIQYLFTLHLNSILILPVPHLLFFQLLHAHVSIIVVIISFLLYFSLVILNLIPVPPISLYAHLPFAPFLQIPTLLPYLVLQCLIIWILFVSQKHGSNPPLPLHNLPNVLLLITHSVVFRETPQIRLEQTLVVTPSFYS